jgi:hypothetical protein
LRLHRPPRGFLLHSLQRFGALICFVNLRRRLLLRVLRDLRRRPLLLPKNRLGLQNPAPGRDLAGFLRELRLQLFRDEKESVSLS